ncbi:MAG: hypothetical protein DMG21_20625 [Acidobacteria bacterium]|nr:MAG: hypothetical protein DMG21_20625 [Acidobacteriota bacterium]
MTFPNLGPEAHEKLRSFFPFHLLLAAVLLIVVYMVGGSGVGDPDIWWHLKNAQYLFNTGKIPSLDMYSYTVAGQPWMNHEWLAEVPYYLAWRAFGLPGIWVVFLGVLDAMVAGLFFWIRRTSGNPKGAFLAAFFCILLMGVSFGPRTILFGYVDLEILLILLWRYRNGLSKNLWALPVLFLFWVNTHGSWLLGMVIFGIVGASGLVGGQWGRIAAQKWSPDQLRHLVKVGLASVAALFINPYGYRLVYYPFDLAYTQKLNIANIEEWASVDFHTGRGKVVFFLVIVLLVGALVDRRNWTLPDLALAVFGLYCGITYVRFLFLAALLIAPVLARFLDFLPPYRPGNDKPVLNAVLLLFIAGFFVWHVPSEKKLRGQMGHAFPVNAMGYIQLHGLPENVFNLYSWGGYLEWYRPETKVFIDSRTDIFEYAGVFKDYFGIARIEDTYALLDKYQIRSVFLPPDYPICYMLEHRPEWKIMYKDSIAVLLVREGPAPSPPKGRKVQDQDAR